MTSPTHSRESLVSWNSYNESLGTPYHGTLDWQYTEMYRAGYDAAVAEFGHRVARLVSDLSRPV